MSSRYYPIWQRGNPQLRVFLPNFWMKLIKPEEPTPPNIVQFITSQEMTHHDVRNYLEKIYKIPVVDVKVEMKTGEFRRCPEKGHIIKDDDFKLATVILRRGVNFSFPNVVKEKDKDSFKETQKEFKKHKEEAKKLKPTNPNRPFLPSWFSH